MQRRTMILSIMKGEKTKEAYIWSNFIYPPTQFFIILTNLLLSRIPEERQLAAVPKAAVAKPSPLAAKLGNPDAPELFESLVPVAVHQALAAYELRKSEIVNREVDKLKEATNLANQLLSSMNLPAALEDTKGKKNINFSTY